MPVCNKEKVKQFRLKAGLSQNKMSRLADIDRATYRKAELGGNVSELTVQKIATAISQVNGSNVTAHEITV